MKKFPRLMKEARTPSSVYMDRPRFLKALKYLHLEMAKLNKEYKEVNRTPLKSQRLVFVDGTHPEGYKSMSYLYGDEYNFFDENGKYHRIGGPCYITSEIAWWQVHGKYHREDGPAMVSLNTGVIQFWVNDKLMSEEEYLKHFESVI